MADAADGGTGGGGVSALDVREPRPARRGKPAGNARQGRAQLISVGTAVPHQAISQAELEAIMAEIWELTTGQRERWKRIVAGTGIERRHGVLPPPEVVGLSTAQRMQAYEKYAPPLAADAAHNAIEIAGIQADQITDLIVVSCTGFAAPGVDVELVQRLGLRPTVRRNTIGFMGCFGAITGLRAAVGTCCADVKAIALVVCVELCSLHMRRDRDVQNQVAAALFADGAAAGVVVNASHPSASSNRHIATSPHHHFGHLQPGASLLLPTPGKDWMSWRITDAGFAMTLSREVPSAIREALSEFVSTSYRCPNWTYAIHPGGPGILDAADQALGLRDARGLECSRAVLRDFGNMSSSTVLFVLERVFAGGYEAPILLLAFGPGLTIESLPVLPV